MVDLSQPVTDVEDARARLALIAALLDVLVGKTAGDVQQEAAAVRDLARQAAGPAEPAILPTN